MLAFLEDGLIVAFLQGEGGDCLLWNSRGIITHLSSKYHLKCLDSVYRFDCLLEAIGRGKSGSQRRHFSVQIVGQTLLQKILVLCNYN